MNLKAFEAKLYAICIGCILQGPAVRALRQAFETTPPRAAKNLDYEAMAAAQWIIWGGQILFHSIVCDTSSGQNEVWSFGENFEGASMEPAEPGKLSTSFDSSQMPLQLALPSRRLSRCVSPSLCLHYNR